LSADTPGIAIGVGGRGYFLPVERIAFVAPIRIVEDGRLVLARGRLPLLDLGKRLGLPHRSEEKSAVGVEGRRGFFAVAAETVRWVEGSQDSSGLEALDLDTLWTPEEEDALFP
jgi:hypothetical protein